MSLKKSFRHTGVLMMVGVLALGLLGAAYTLWYEDLTLNTTVQTGTFDVDWSCETPGSEDPLDCSGAAVGVVSLDNGESYHYDTTLPPLSEIEGIEEKLPTCTAAISDDPTGDQTGAGGTNNVLDIGVGTDLDDGTTDDVGAYPYAGCEIWFDIHNAGTVPAHLTVISATNDEGFDPTDVALELGDESDEACTTLVAAIFVANVTGEQVPVEGLQLHQGDELVCHLIVTVNQSAEEGVSFTNTVVLRAHQWNEDADDAPPAP
jgi:hypothetical protein